MGKYLPQPLYWILVPPRVGGLTCIWCPDFYVWWQVFETAIKERPMKACLWWPGVLVFMGPMRLYPSERQFLAGYHPRALHRQHTETQPWSFCKRCLFAFLGESAWGNTSRNLWEYSQGMEAGDGICAFSPFLASVHQCLWKGSPIFTAAARGLL